MTTVFRVLAGIVAACLMAALVKVLHVITPAGLAEAGALAGRLPRLAELTALTATQEALFIIPLGIAAAVVTETNRIRSWFAYAILGLLIAAAGFFVQQAGESAVRTIVNPYAGQAYALAGVLGGLAYWLVAGRYAGWRRGGGLVKTRPYPVGRPRLRVSDAEETDTPRDLKPEP